MSLEMLARALDSRAKGSTRCVLLGLANMAQPDGLAWPSRRTLRRWANCSDPTISKALEELEAMGEIVRAPRYAKDGRQRSSAYLLPLWADPAAVAETLRGQDERAEILALFYGGEGKPLFTLPPQPVFTPPPNPSLQGGVNPSLPLEPKVETKLNVNENPGAPDGAAARAAAVVPSALREDQRMFAARCAADGVEPRALVPAQRGRYNAEIKAWRAARVTADQFEAAVADWKTTWKGRQPGATPSRADLDAAIARVRSRGATSPETPLQEQQRLQQVFLGAAAAQPSAAAAEGDMPF